MEADHASDDATAAIRLRVVERARRLPAADLDLVGGIVERLLVMP